MEYTVPQYKPLASSNARTHRPTFQRTRRQGDRVVRKRTVKYLSVVRDPKVYNSIVKTAPDAVIKSICDAALNVQRGDRVSLKPSQKALF